ncbi:uncharacterized protein ACRADG_003777 isoform 2-T2 [Cochliomyia hominivorax]
MSENDFEDFAKNIEIMQIIFELLNFEEQLKLAQVSQQLKYIFTNFVWKVNYEKICIIKNPPGFHIKNETDLNKLKLTANEFEEFLKVYRSDIKELTERCDPWLDVRVFPNLTSLSYGNMSVTKSQFQSVAQHCKNLERLIVKTCCNEDNDMLELGRDLEINTLLEMKKLKCLEVASCIQLGLSYLDFLELVTKSKIKHLILFYYIESEDEVDVSDRDTTNSLEELHVCTTFEEKWYLMNFSGYLKFFENLTILSLNKGDDIDNNTIEVLAKTCKKLKVLSLNFADFDNVSNFNLLISIEDFSIQMGNGLTYKNLRQILTEMNLLKFTSMQTEYEGEFENFTISNKLEALNVHNLKTHQFKGAYEENQTLKSLVWYDDFYEPAVLPTSLKCPNLEYLEIHSGFMPLEMLMQLKSLVTLSLEYSDKQVTWSYVIQLLRDHASLRDLKLEDLCEGLSKNTPTEAFDCAVNLKSITISPNVFEESTDFWLDLLDKNRHLNLNCAGLIHPDLLHKILNSSKFPNSWRIIYIDGFKVAPFQPTVLIPSPSYMIN